MKIVTTIAAIAMLVASSSAIAWNNGGYGNNSGYGNGTGDFNGDFDTSFSFNMNAKGRGNGNANGYNNWNGYNGYNGNNNYAPYGTPLTAEQMIEQRAAFEKAQKEAFERHQQAIKNLQTQTPAYPSSMPVEMQARHDAFMKSMQKRREAAQKRHEEMMNKYNEARTSSNTEGNS